MKVVKKIEYVLQKPLRKKGEIGDVVRVTRGFGRYLESQSIAKRATEEILKNLEESKKIWQQHEVEHEAQALVLVEKVKGIELVIKKRVAQGEKLYESVRPEHIVAAFKDRGVVLENNNIKLNNQIKKLGDHKIIIHAYGNHEVALTIKVISDADELM